MVRQLAITANSKLRLGGDMADRVEVVEYFRSNRATTTQFDSRREAEAFVRAQGDEPGVEWVIYEY